MPRMMEGFCCNEVCTNELPKGPGTQTFMLEEEAGFTPRPHYCCEECAKYTWNRFYNASTHKVNGVYPWEERNVTNV